MLKEPLGINGLFMRINNIDKYYIIIQIIIRNKYYSIFNIIINNKMNKFNTNSLFIFTKTILFLVELKVSFEPNHLLLILFGSKIRRICKYSHIMYNLTK